MLVEYAVRGSLDTLLSDLAEKNAPPSEAVNPKPYTLHPTPYTLNLEPEARNPELETLSSDAGANHDRAADLRCHGPARRTRSEKHDRFRQNFTHVSRAIDFCD